MHASGLRNKGVYYFGGGGALLWLGDFSLSFETSAAEKAPATKSKKGK